MNKPPPPGSFMIRKYELPEVTEPQIPQPQEDADPEPNEGIESTPQQPETK